MKQILIFISFSALLLVSCKTNPPAAPFDNRISGKIFLNVSFDFTPQNKVVDKVVLLEDFANVSCVPCVISNKIIKDLTHVTYGHSKLAAIKFPTNFPAPNDPFYIANKPDCDSRISYYNVFFAPTTIIDGILRPASTDSNSIKQRIDERLTINPIFEIIINDEFVDGSYYVNIQVNVLSGSIDFTNIILHTVILESEIEFDDAPGSNNETKFYDVMRVMLPSNEGISISEVQQSGSTVIEVEGDLRELWNNEKLNTVSYIQNISTKEVFQTGSTL